MASGVGILRALALSQAMTDFAGCPGTQAFLKLCVAILLGAAATDDAAVAPQVASYTHALVCAMRGGTERMTVPTYHTRHAAAAAAAEREVDDAAPENPDLAPEDVFALLVGIGDSEADIREAFAGAGLPAAQLAPGGGGGGGGGGLADDVAAAYAAQLPQQVQGVHDLLRARGTSTPFSTYDLPCPSQGMECIRIGRDSLEELDVRLLDAITPFYPGGEDMAALGSSGATLNSIHGVWEAGTQEQCDAIKRGFSTDALLQAAATRHVLQTLDVDGPIGAAAKQAFIMSNTCGTKLHGPVGPVPGTKHDVPGSFSRFAVLGALRGSDLAQTAKALAIFLIFFAPPYFAFSDTKSIGFKNWTEHGLKVGSWQDRATAMLSM